MNQQEKERAIKIHELELIRVKLIGKLLQISLKKPSKYAKTNTSRAFRSFAISLEMISVVNEIRKIRSQPFLKEEFQGGVVTGIVGNNSEEITCMRGHYFDPMPQKAKCMHVQPDGTLKEIKITDLKE